MLRTELHDCLARAGSVLGRAEAALAKLEVVPNVSSLPELQIGVVPDVSLLPEIQVGSVDGEACMYVDLSPRATSCRLPLPAVPITSGVKLLSRSWLRCCRLCLSFRRFVGSLLRLFRWCFLRRWGRLEGTW